MPRISKKTEPTPQQALDKAMADVRDTLKNAKVPVHHADKLLVELDAYDDDIADAIELGESIKEMTRASFR